MSRLAGELLQRHIGRLAVRPADMDRRRSVALFVDLGDHEVPFAVVALVTREGSRVHRNEPRVAGLAGYHLSSNMAARRTRTQEHERQADQAEYARGE